MNKRCNTEEEALAYAQKLVDQESELIKSIEQAASTSDFQSTEKLGIEYSKIQSVALLAKKLLALKEEVDTGQELLATSNRDLSITKELNKAQTLLNSAIQDLQSLLFNNTEKSDSIDSVIVEINPGTGGDEAGIFAADLLRMYQRYAEFKNWDFQITNLNHGKPDSIKEARVKIVAPGALRIMKLESGVHRVQRVPATESMGRVHTSTAAVCVFPEPEKINVEIHDKDLRIERCRASGPGGQSVNTTDSAITILHIPTGIRVSQRDERSQSQNERKARAVLAERLAEKMHRELADSVNSERFSQSGSRERSDKIRTYNFSQNRITDHLRGVTTYKLDRIIQGQEELDEFFDQLLNADVHQDAV